MRDVIRLLSPVNQKDVLDPNKIIPDGPNNGRTVLQLLKEKHPESHSPHPDALMNEPLENYFPYLIFEALNEETIRFAALHTNSSAGPSGADALSWRHWCSCYGRCQSICVDPLELLVERYETAMLIQLVCQHSPPAI